MYYRELLEVEVVANGAVPRHRGGPVVQVVGVLDVRPRLLTEGDPGRGQRDVVAGRQLAHLNTKNISTYSALIIDGRIIDGRDF